MYHLKKPEMNKQTNQTTKPTKQQQKKTTKKLSLKKTFH